LRIVGEPRWRRISKGEFLWRLDSIEALNDARAFELDGRAESITDGAEEEAVLDG
jgi:hypothetical protein